MAKTILMCSVALAAVAYPSTQAIAQSAQTQAAPPSGQSEPAANGSIGQTPEPGDIIVTARKRQESILNVPVVETVLSQQQIQQSATGDFQRLKIFVPGLLLGQSTNSVGLQVSLRGIGTTAQNATMDQSISLNIDGLPLGQGVAYTAGMFDLGQIEVLKGPQALFYGKNSPGGVISLRTADPTNDFEVIGRTSYEFYANEKIGELIVSGPVSDSLKLRFAGHYGHTDGFFKNTAVAIPNFGSVTPDKDIPVSTLMLRGTAIYHPISSYTARLKLNYTRDHTSGLVSPLMPVYCPDGTGAVPGFNIPFLQGSTCTIGRDYKIPWADPAAYDPSLPNGGVYFSLSKQYFGTLDQTANLMPGLSVNSVTGYYKNTYNSLMHGSTTSAIEPFAQAYRFANRQFTQEVRLTSDFKDSPINFMLGGFYQHGHMTNLAHIYGNRTLGLPATIQWVNHEVYIDSYSLFGQGIWDITRKLELAAGARYTNETRNHTEYNFNAGNGPVGYVPSPDPRIHSGNVSPEISLTYKPTTDFTVFGSYKQGFKSGSFNSINYVSPTTPASFRDEKVKGFEAGIKTRLFDHRATFNLAAYDYKYSDLQVGALELQQQNNGAGTAFVFVQRTLNAATARVKGIEAEFTYNPDMVPGLTLRSALNYNHARYLSFPNAPCGNGQTIAQGCNQLFNATLNKYGAQDLTGRPLVRAPDWTATAGLNYERPINQSLSFIFGADANYTSSYVTTLVDLPGFRQKEFAKFNLNFTLRGEEGGWELAVISNNVGNKLTRGLCFNSNVQNGTILGGQISGTATQGPAKNDEAVCAIDQGRQVILRLTVRPFALLHRR